MKKTLLMAICLLLSIGVTSASTIKTFDKTSVSISEDNKTYELKADYDEAKTDKLRSYLDKHLKSEGFSFKNSETDATISVDGKTLYVKNATGKLVLKLDKKKNSAEFYGKVKKMCDGISGVLNDK